MASSFISVTVMYTPTARSNAPTVGKATLTPEITKAAEEALEARELIKIHVLKNCFADIREIASVLAERTHAEVVQVIGRKIVLYRESATKKRIELP